MKTSRLRIPRSACRKAGFTIVELMISLGISSLILIIIADVQLISARSIKKLFGETYTRSSRMAALDVIRYRLANADGGPGAINITNDGQRIEFTDPYSTKTSAFYFVPEERKLFYDDDIHDGDDGRVAVKGPIAVKFAEFADTETTGTADSTVITVSVKSASDTPRADVDIEDGTTAVFIPKLH